MSEQAVKIGTRLLLALPLMYLVYSCYTEKQDIRIIPVTQPKQWTYDLTTIPLGERRYVVLIDGELDREARLDHQTQRTTANSTRKKPDTTFVDAWTSRLPRGKFSLYYSRDDSGPEAFAYRPLRATKGWVRVQIRPGEWNGRDSSRKLLGAQSYQSYPISIRRSDTFHEFVFHP